MSNIQFHLSLEVILHCLVKINHMNHWTSSINRCYICLSTQLTLLWYQRKKGYCLCLLCLGWTHCHDLRVFRCQHEGSTGTSTVSKWIPKRCSYFQKFWAICQNLKHMSSEVDPLEVEIERDKGNRLICFIFSYMQKIFTVRKISTRLNNLS